MRITKKTSNCVLVAGVMALAACGGSSGGGSGSGGSGGSGDKYSKVPALDYLKGRKLVISTWGGVWTDTTKKYLTDPFSKDTGVTVQFVVNGNDTVAPALLQV